MFELPITDSSAFTNCQIIVLNKANLTNGTGAVSARVFTPKGGDNAFSLKPATVLGGNSPGNVAYFVETPLSSTTSIRIWAVSDPLGTPTLTSSTVTVPDNGGKVTAGAPQPGTGILLDTLSPETQGNAFWLNGGVWFCHTAGGSAGRAIVYYYDIALNGFPIGTPSRTESFGIDGGAGVWNYQPAIGANAQHDLCLVFTQSSASMFPTIMYAGRAAHSAFFESPAVLHASPGFYNGTTNSLSMNTTRWGDYATVSADPITGSLWVSHEWARTTTLDDWSTWWGNIATRTITNVIYVDQSSTAFLQEGSAVYPFLTVSQANQVAYDGNTIRIQAGDYPGFPTTFKRSIRVESQNGAVTIGR